MNVRLILFRPSANDSGESGWEHLARWVCVPPPYRCWWVTLSDLLLPYGLTLIDLHLWTDTLLQKLNVFYTSKACRILLKINVHPFYALWDYLVFSFFHVFQKFWIWNMCHCDNNVFRYPPRQVYRCLLTTHIGETDCIAPDWWEYFDVWPNMRWGRQVLPQRLSPATNVRCVYPRGAMSEMSHTDQKT
jgi:hypothetical protein